MKFLQRDTAFAIRMAIESQQDPVTIKRKVQELVFHLDGTADTFDMDPGQAALYLLSLVLTQPEDE